MTKWQKEILKLEKRFDRDMGKDLREAYQAILDEAKTRLKDYLEHYEELPYWQQQQAGYYAQLEEELIDILGEGTPEAKKIIEEYKEKAMTEGYESVHYQCEMGTLQTQPFLGLQPRVIRTEVEKPVAGKTLSKRLYRNRRKLAKNVRSQLRVGLVLGDSYAKMANRIASSTEANLNQALRIARTEAGRLRSISKEKGYAEAIHYGVDLKKRWVSAMDSRVRATHGGLDGQVIEYDEKFRSPSGATAKGPRLFGVAAEDINCRCTTIAQIGDEGPGTRRNGEGDVIPYRTFQEWKKERLEGQPYIGNFGLSMAKERGKKVNITNQAIEKVQNINISGYSDAENRNILLAHQQLLKDSKDNNRSNEVMHIMRDGPPIVVYGSKDAVDINQSPQARYLLNSSPDRSLTVLHNHPGGSSFSNQDLALFYTTDSVRTLTAVSNQGKVIFMTKNRDYNKDSFRKAIVKYSDKLYDKDSKIQDAAMLALLKEARKCGVNSKMR
ncbi:MAG: phage minor head protein [Aerococcus sanguinicola]